MHNGILLVDKPVGFSSFQIVRVLKRQHKKVGHAGTLDPFASGLLIILIGEGTKKCLTIHTFEKEYIGELILGMSTNTYDISGAQIDNLRNGDNVPDQDKSDAAMFSLQKFNEVARSFIGKIEQRPPLFSAIKHRGRRLYQLVREGIEVTPKRRKVFVKSFTITRVQYPILSFNAVVGKGVYVRSLANDFGNMIGCGANLMSLRRIRIGDYYVAQAKTLGDILNSHR